MLAIEKEEKGNNLKIRIASLFHQFMTEGLLNKLSLSGLRGRGGGSFSTYKKWEAFLQSSVTDKYIICNGAEGEPEGYKDGYILNHYLEDVTYGVALVSKLSNTETAYFYLRKDYFQKHSAKIIALLNDLNIKVIEKPDIGYIAGEETVVCRIIEGERPLPCKKPPYLAEKGLFGRPTLINNVETFYAISRIDKGEYTGERFYGIMGNVQKPGTYIFPENTNISDILKKTDNYPDFDFFIQAGGISGEILLSHELDKPLEGAGFIRIYSLKDTDCYQLIEYWANFFHQGNCDKCTPCSDGFYRISEMFKERKVDFSELEELLFSLKMSSFCALGKNAYLPFSSLINKVIKHGRN